MTRVKIASAALFNVGWFASVIGAGQGLPWLGPIVVALLTVAHLWYFRFDHGFALLLAAGFAIGWAADAAVALGGWLGFPEHAELGRPVAMWMPFMWINFVSALPLSLSFLRRRYLLGAAVGLFGGPSAYYAGMKLGAVELADPLFGSLLAIGAEYLIAMPLLMLIADRLWPDSRRPIAESIPDPKSLG